MNRINLICLGVKDVGKSMKFYQGIGFKCYEKAENPPIVFFDNQGTKLELFQLDELAKDINIQSPPKRSTSEFGGFTLAINMKTKAEVDNFFLKVTNNQGKIVKPPQIVSWGGYSGYFKDLDGYYWEVAYGKDWEFDEQEMLIIK